VKIEETISNGYYSVFFSVYKTKRRLHIGKPLFRPCPDTTPRRYIEEMLFLFSQPRQPTAHKTRCAVCPFEGGHRYETCRGPQRCRALRNFGGGAQLRLRLWPFGSWAILQYGAGVRFDSSILGLDVGNYPSRPFDHRRLVFSLTWREVSPTLQGM